MIRGAGQGILKRIEEGEEAVTSTLVLWEVAWVMEAMGGRGSIKESLEEILSYEALKTVGFDEDDLLVGASNMVVYKLDFNEGVNLALMIRLGVSEVYSSDRKHLGKLEFLDPSF